VDVLHQFVYGGERAAAGAANLDRARQDLSRRSEDVELAQLVCKMLAAEPGERPPAREVAEALAELVNVHTCCVCHCPEPRERGLECTAAERHFACDECFSLHIQRLEALCEHADKLPEVKCSVPGCTAAFSLREAAKHATELAFEKLLSHVDDLKLVAVQGKFQQWKENFQADFAAKSEKEQLVIAARKHIEEMMDLRCPKCRRVFDQYEGCAALTCAYAGCNAHFCAFCLADCGADAHSHVRGCSLNPKKNGYFVSKDEWARIMDSQRREKLNKYWSTLAVGVKDALAACATINQILRDLRLDRMLGTATFAAEMAQLRGMGFTDEQAMRHELEGAGGNVQRAVERLCASAEP